MATLTIGDKKINIDDGFLKLSPDDQQRAVDEIAGQLDPSLMESISKGVQNFIPELKGYYPEHASLEQGMPLDQAVAKARGEFGQEIGTSAPPILPGTNAQGPAQPITSILPKAVQPENLPETWKGVKNYIATKPVEAIAQAVLAVTPLPKGLGLASRAEHWGSLLPTAAEKEAAATAAEMGIPEKIAALPETAPLSSTPPSTPAPATRAALKSRAQEMKAAAGARMQAIKDETPSINAEDLRPVVQQIKTDTASQYNKHIHGATTGIYEKLDELLPPPVESKKPFYTSPQTKELQQRVNVMGADISKFSPEVQAKIMEAESKGAAPAAPTAPPKLISVKQIHDIQRSLRSLNNSRDLPEVENAKTIKDHLDDFIETKMGAPGWGADKRSYAIASTALEIENLVARAKIRESNLSAGQKGAAIATELRQFARDLPGGKGENRNIRMLRSLSPEAADKLKRAASGGGTLDQILKALGTAAPTNLINFGVADLAGHLLHAILPVFGPMTVMATGAFARYLRGARAESSMTDIIDTVLKADSIGKLGNVIGQPVLNALAERPSTRQAVLNWAGKSGSRTIVSHTLAVAIARQLNTPTMVPRIENEINNLDNESNVSKTNRVETRY